MVAKGGPQTRGNITFAVVDDLYKKLNKKHFCTVGYTEEITILIKVNYTNTL